MKEDLDKEYIYPCEKGYARCSKIYGWFDHDKNTSIKKIMVTLNLKLILPNT